MRVLFVSRHPSEVVLWKAEGIFPRMRHLPCELFECYSTTNIRKYLRSADVVLLDRYAFVPYIAGMRSIYKSRALVGQFHTDYWNTYVAEDRRKLDVRIVAYSKLLNKYKPGWAKVAFWSPHCIDVQDYSLPRDIDILFWGAWGTAYPFRGFVRQQLSNRVVGNPQKVDPFLTVSSVVISGRKYKYATIVSIPNPGGIKPSNRQIVFGYYGSRLFRLLSRVKICCTGSAWGVPVGKYVEHAACGAVTISNSFTDAEALGFVHKETIWFTNRKNFMKDLRYLLEHDDVVQTISGNAKELVRTRHTPAIRAQELYKFLCEKTGKT